MEITSSSEPDPGAAKSKIIFSAPTQLKLLFSKTPNFEKEIMYLQKRLKNTLKFFDENLHQQIIFDAFESYKNTIKYSSFPVTTDIVEQFEKDLKFVILVLAQNPKDLVRLYVYIKNGRFFAPCPNKNFHQKQISEMLQEIKAIKI